MRRKSSSLRLEDLVIAYTDGIVEATNQNGDEWGVRGLLKAAACGAQCSPDAGDLVNLMFHSMDEFSQGHQTDDATLAVCTGGVKNWVRVFWRRKTA